MFVLLFEFHLELRSTSYSEPWNRLVPLLVTALICNPLDRPYSAW